MKKTILFTSIAVLMSVTQVQAASNSGISHLQQVYITQGATTADQAQGKRLWLKEYPADGEYSRRSCTTCHTEDLSRTGKHIKTGKERKPMSAVTNPQRYTDTKKISKWFKRNCKWTMGRECTAQEKADILSYISNQSKF